MKGGCRPSRWCNAKTLTPRTPAIAYRKVGPAARPARAFATSEEALGETPARANKQSSPKALTHVSRSVAAATPIAPLGSLLWASTSAQSSGNDFALTANGPKSRPQHIDRCDAAITEARKRQEFARPAAISPPSKTPASSTPISAARRTKARRVCRVTLARRRGRTAERPSRCWLKQGCAPGATAPARRRRRASATPGISRLIRKLRQSLRTRWPGCPGFGANRQPDRAHASTLTTQQS